MNNSIPYWESETPEVIDTRKQRFSFYKDAKVLEIAALINEDGSTKPIRRQALSASMLLHNPAVCDMLLDFLSAAGLVSKVD